MAKVSLFSEFKEFKLEEKVNNFIKDKKVINVSYSVENCGYEYIYCCCVLYE